MPTSLDRTEETRYWTARAKWMGNLWPLLPGLPFLGIGITLWITTQRFFGADLIFLILGCFLPILALNWLALVGNQAMKSDFYARHSRTFMKTNDTACYFFGMASPGFRSLIDPHEDIGFLIFGEESIRFFGEKHHWEAKVRDIKGLGWRANEHSLVGMGGFAVLKWIETGRPREVFLESRDKASLIANKKHTDEVLRALQRQVEANRPPQPRNCQASKCK